LVIAKPGLSPKRLTLKIESRLNQQTPIVKLANLINSPIDKNKISNGKSKNEFFSYQSKTIIEAAVDCGGRSDASFRK